MSQTRKILQGSASNVARFALSMAIALILPPLLVHQMAPAEYSAWVLILQCSGYVALLDFGLQTAVGKFVAEHDANNDRTASSHVLSSSFAILCSSALLGTLIIIFIAWRVPQLFHQMPPFLIGDVRMGILAVGLSTVVALPFGSFLAVFTGLQRYGFPTALAMTSKILQSAVLVLLLLMHKKLGVLVWVLAGFNLVTAVAQFAGWKRYASDRVGFGLQFTSRKTMARLVKYGGVLSVWIIAGLLVNGLDLVIVGHYDYKNTGYYGIALAVTNFMVLVIGGLFSPLVPAVSSLQTQQSRHHIGKLTIESTRYCTLILSLLGLPLAFGAYPVLKLWVGRSYAVQSVSFLQVLVLGNVIRQLGYPYSLAVIATGRQHLATIAALAEAVVNVGVSLYLVQRVGAIGAAIGTVCGALITVALHLAVSMKYTQSTVTLSRRDFLIRGIFRPLLCTSPSLLLLPLWDRFAMLPWSAPLLAAWAVATLLIAWQLALTGTDRKRVSTTLSRLARLHYAKAT